MGDSSPPDAAPSAESRRSNEPEASVAPPPLLEGIVRVKVPSERIQPFLARIALFKGASKETVGRVAGMLQGLECAEGSEIVTAGTANDGIGILYSGSAQVMVPAQGGAVLPVEDIEAGDHFGEVGALLGRPSPYYVVATAASRVLWLPAYALRGLVGNVATVAEALSRRLAERVTTLAALERQGAPELITDMEAQLRATAEAPPPRPLQQESEPDQPGTVRFAEVRDFDLSPSVLSMVPTKFVRTYRLLPVKLAGRRLTVAMVNPRDNVALAELKRTLQTVEIVPVAIGLEDFNSALVRLKLSDDPGAAGLRRTAPRINPDSFQFETVAEQERGTDVRAVGDDAIRLVNRIIAAGLEREASDIHIEPTPQGFRVRFRVNGILQDWSEPLPAGSSLKGITARVKVLAGLDITERRLPQDGRIGIAAGKREIDLRVSTLPASRGEKIALRILEAGASMRRLEEIFFEPAVLAALRKALNRPYGAILVCGPTGSGKTSSLYAVLNERKVTRPDTNIIMVEDPIEYRLGGVTQVQVNAAVGLGFAQVLRSMLRQDPDVIVVGEMRDHETAQLALEAAMTGHLLFSSLHANNAAAAIQRLENLGCSRALIAQSIALVLVQRLVRKLCSACRKLDPPNRALLESLASRGIVRPGEQMLPRAVGCDACAGTGYVGRAVVVEALQINDAVREAVAAGKPLSEVQQIARESRALLPFVDYARALLQKQVISPSEVLLSIAE
ncbi:MAG TPA: ATPase, T2SS/T4P/T4SS family [Myxococcales bacterium]|nr:ATPase, T2SS/T4P/T4SS family [Myxococcales bacterium]